MSSKKSRYSQRAITRAKIKRLQRAGLLSDKVNPNRKPSEYVKRQFHKYAGVLKGNKVALRLSTADMAAKMRGKLGEGGQGRVVIVPREKGERFRVTKNDEIKSTRKAYGSTIAKTIGDKFTPPKPGEKLYYSLPTRRRGLGKLKRKIFSSFDELLFYLSKYEINFEDIEDYIEVERTTAGSAKQRRVAEEYREAVRRLKKKKRTSKSRR